MDGTRDIIWEGSAKCERGYLRVCDGGDRGAFPFNFALERALFLLCFDVRSLLAKSRLTVMRQLQQWCP